MKQKWQRPLELREYLEKTFSSVRVENYFLLPGIRAYLLLLQLLNVFQKHTDMNQLLELSTGRWRRWSLVSSTDHPFQIDFHGLKLHIQIISTFSSSTIHYPGLTVVWLLTRLC